MLKTARRERQRSARRRSTRRLEPAGESSRRPGSSGPSASLEEFIGRLARMTLADLEAISTGIEAEMASSADWLAWRRAIEASDRALRRVGRVREAGAAAHAAAEAVLAAMHDQVNLPDARVTSVARWARDVAAALVTEDVEPRAARTLMRPWVADCSVPAA